jgi:ssDNA-binding replication factor A large subunit
MTVEEIIERIQLRLPELSRDQILGKLEDKRRKTGGLISDEILLRMIASEFDVEIKNNDALTLTLSLRDLVPGLNNVSVIGRTVAVFSPRTFEGNRSGKFASLLIADKTTVLRIVLWDSKADLIEADQLKTGQIIRFSHGYTREDRAGKVELHVGDKGEVEITPSDVDANDYPTISKFTTKIRDITESYKNKRVNVIGTVKELFPTSSFERRDSTSGKVMRLKLADEAGEILAVVWNEKVDEIENKLSEGVELQIVNAKAKKSLNGGLEVHVDAGTFIEMLPPTERFFKIAGLSEGSTKISVEGVVTTKPILRDVKTSKKEIVKLASFELRDETGSIWVSVWRDQTDSVKSLKVGDRIIMKNACVKKGFGNQLELSTRSTTSISIHDSD